MYMVRARFLSRWICRADVWPDDGWLSFGSDSGKLLRGINHSQGGTNFIRAARPDRTQMHVSIRAIHCQCRSGFARIALFISFSLQILSEQGEPTLKHSLRHLGSLVRAALDNDIDPESIQQAAGFEHQQRSASAYVSKLLGQNDIIVQKVVRKYFDIPVLDILQGFDCFVSSELVPSCFVFLRIWKPNHSTDLGRPSSSQVALALIILDFVDVKYSRKVSLSSRSFMMER
ncbi:hypothetical protein SISNIDRAFT_279834 [Sistotremastrum niveocremeum HHB9708]|uniref:Uncharacterized protein n=1 Tax=Sistotremastrum niveocremeum HHB9708 TaxID=1314777 RepID=A0A164NR24_9AGAM|nr:hypothetical protein SISNIDRAFT_279834 [Sistotremastrum niveocremeum HHB9708]